MSTPWSSATEVDRQSECSCTPDPLPVRASVAAIGLQSRLHGRIVSLFMSAVTHGDLTQSGELIHPPERVQRVDVSPRGRLERINRRSL
jgi:hypothetical protein